MPIMWAIGAGSDVMKRIAAPLIGGIFTSFVLELIVYPAIYEIWKWHTEVKRLRGQAPARQLESLARDLKGRERGPQGQGNAGLTGALVIGGPGRIERLRGMQSVTQLTAVWEETATKGDAILASRP